MLGSPNPRANLPLPESGEATEPSPAVPWMFPGDAEGPRRWEVLTAPWAAAFRRAEMASQAVLGAPPLVQDLLALAFLAAVVLLFLWDGIALGRIHFQADTIEFYYPFLYRYDRAVDRGSAPLWAPEIFAGYPLYADGEAGVFSPINFLAVQFLSPFSALLWSRIARLILAAWFSYGYGRAIGLSRLGSMVVGLVFCLGSFLMIQLHHANIINTAIWLPLILCFIELGMPAAGLRRHGLLLGAGVGLGVAALGLHVQILLMMAPLVALYIVFRALWGPFGSASPARPPEAVQVPAAGLGIFQEWMARAVPGTVVRFIQDWRRVAEALVGGELGLARRLIVMVYALVVVLGVAVSLSMVQLLPLWELSRQSARGTNLGYGYASTYSMTPYQLIDLLFPYFFRTADRQWWSLWAEWESTLYIGIAPLLLAVLAALLVRSRYTVFFLTLGTGAVVLSLGAYAPFDLHRRLWELPGFDLMRAPGRFTFLAVFAGAVLAGLGADWLDRYLLSREPIHWRWTPMRDLVGHLRPAGLGLFLLVAVLCIAAVVWALAAGRSWALENQQTVLDWARQEYLTQPKGRVGVTPQLVYEGLVQSLDVRQMRTLVGVGLLAGSAGLLAALAVVRGLAPLWRGALLLLIAGDLLFFARGFHPMIWREELEQPKSFVSARPGVTQEEPAGPRSFATYLGNSNGLFRAFGDPWPQDARPNRLLPYGVSLVGGYASLAPTRHQQYAALLRLSERTLLSLAGVRYVVRPARSTPLPTVQGMSYHPGRPLLQGAPASPNASGSFRVVPLSTDAIKLVAGMESALELPDGAPVAEITVHGAGGQRETVIVRAGVHVSDQAAEVAEVADRLRHQRPKTVAFRDVREDPWYQRYRGVVSFAEIPLPRTVTAPTRVEFRTVLPQGRLKVYGMALQARPSLNDHQIRPEDNEQYQLVHEDPQVRIFEYSGYLPRTFLVAKSRFVPSDSTTLRLMAEDAFDARRAVWLEGGPADTAQPDGARSPLAAPVDTDASPGEAEIVSYRALRVTVEADAARPGYLVLTDSFYPGWRAYVDGVEAPIYRANYLFRAVPLAAGQHLVEFVFAPESVVAGARLSLSVAGLVLFFFAMFGLVRLAPPLDRRLARSAARLRPRLSVLRKRSWSVE